MKVLALRRPDACSRCAKPLAAGTKAAWDAAERRTYCLSCHKDSNTLTDPRTPTQTPTVGVEVTPEGVSGGISAQLQYDKRAARREQQTRQQHPRLGGSSSL